MIPSGKKERTTYVFEFNDGESPAVGRDTQFHGGRLNAVAYYDAISQLDEMRDCMEELIGEIEDQDRLLVSTGLMERIKAALNAA